LRLEVRAESVVGMAGADEGIIPSGVRRTLDERGQTSEPRGYR
jgi:hypothetical protein